MAPSPAAPFLTATSSPFESLKSFQSFYISLTTHKVPGPRSLSYFIPPLFLLPLALLIPPSVLSQKQLCMIFLPLILACEIDAWRAMGGPDVISVCVVQWSLVLLGCYDVRGTFRRVWIQEGREKEVNGRGEGNGEDVGVANGKVRGGGKEGAEGKEEVVVEQVYPQKLGERMIWVATLMLSMRFTGWKIGDESHDRNQPLPRDQRMSRWEYARHVTAFLLLDYLLMDVTTYFQAFDPYFWVSSIRVDDPFAPLTPENELQRLVVVPILRLPPRLVRSTIIAGQIFAMVSGMMYLPTLPMLGLNAVGLVPNNWSPQYWPRLWGKSSVMSRSGLRGLWGSWWHQINRQITSAPGKKFARLLFGKDAHKTTRGYMVAAIVAFGLSGLLHLAMIPPQPLLTALTANAMRLCLGGFFWMQIAGFAVEIALAKGISSVYPGAKDLPGAGMMVLIWVAGWLCMTLPMITIPFRDLGYQVGCPVPFSLVRGLSREGWTVCISS